MRLERMATWTSGEPESVSPRRYSPMSWDFASFVRVNSQVRVSQGPLRSLRRHELAGELDVLLDLLGELLPGVEALLVAQALPELDGEHASEDVPVEIEQVGLQVQGLPP